MPTLPPYPHDAETDVTAPERDTLILEDSTLKHGFIQLPKIILQARNLSRDAKLLYAILLGYAWDDDRCFPGYARLCHDMQASENMVRKYMRELEAVGLLSQKRRGLGKTNLYFMHDIRTSKIAVLDDAKSSAPKDLKIEVNVYKRKQETKNKLTYLRKENISDGIGETMRPEPDQTPSDALFIGSSSEFDVDPDLDPPPPVAEEGSDQPLSALLSARAPKRDATGEDRMAISVTITKFADELGDKTPKSSVTRALNLFQQSSLSRDGFLSLLFEARAATREKRRGIAYLFGVVERQLQAAGMIDGPTRALSARPTG